MERDQRRIQMYQALSEGNQLLYENPLAINVAELVRETKDEIRADTWEVYAERLVGNYRILKKFTYGGNVSVICEHEGQLEESSYDFEDGKRVLGDGFLVEEKQVESYRVFTSRIALVDYDRRGNPIVRAGSQSLAADYKNAYDKLHPKNTEVQDSEWQGTLWEGNRINIDQTQTQPEDDLSARLDKIDSRLSEIGTQLENQQGLDEERIKIIAVAAALEAVDNTLKENIVDEDHVDQVTTLTEDPINEVDDKVVPVLPQAEGLTEPPVIETPDELDDRVYIDQRIQELREELVEEIHKGFESLRDPSAGPKSGDAGVTATKEVAPESVPAGVAVAVAERELEARPDIRSSGVPIAEAGLSEVDIKPTENGNGNGRGIDIFNGRSHIHWEKNRKPDLNGKDGTSYEVSKGPIKRKDGKFASPKDGLTTPEREALKLQSSNASASQSETSTVPGSTTHESIENPRPYRYKTLYPQDEPQKVLPRMRNADYIYSEIDELIGSIDPDEVPTEEVEDMMRAIIKKYRPKMTRRKLQGVRYIPPRK